MKQPLVLLLIILTTATASAQQTDAPRPGANYSSDSFRLRTPGRRISLYAFCTPYSEGRAVYFRKDQDSAVHRVTIRNLRVALADNPASMQELKIAGTNVYVGIGLLAAGIGLAAAGIITTVNHNHQLSNAYNQAAANWYSQAQHNPNTPMPALPSYSGPSPLFYLGAISTLSCIIPFANVAKHARKAVDIYNGIN
jgi:hypothetical protein